MLRYVAKLVTRFNAIPLQSSTDAVGFTAEAMDLLSHLFQIAEKHREEGWNFQRELEGFVRELKESVDEIQKKHQDAEAESETTAEGRAKHLQEYEKQR